MSPMRTFLARSLFAALSLAVAKPAPACDLAVAIDGAKGTGAIYAQVFADAASFAKSSGGIAAFTLAPHTSTTIVFKTLPPGRYAVAAFEDSKGSGKLEKNFLGVPQEPYGFSRDATGTLGPPGFDQAAVDCAGDAATATVHLH